MSNIAKQTQILHRLFAPKKLRKPKIKIPSEENLNDLELQTQIYSPRFFIQYCLKRESFQKRPAPNLTQSIQASPLPSNDFYK